jgi:hypothetical protein
MGHKRPYTIGNAPAAPVYGAFVGALHMRDE